MFKQVSGIPVAVFLAISGFVRDIRKDERGLSGVVVAIFLILVAVLAVVLIWTFLGEWIKEVWDKILKATGTV